MRVAATAVILTVVILYGYAALMVAQIEPRPSGPATHSNTVPTQPFRVLTSTPQRTTGR